MSPELKQFYRELQAWIDGGCPDSKVFNPWNGMCDNLDRWCSCDFPLMMEMSDQFESAGLDSMYPWGREDYIQRYYDDAMYECPKRLAWIKEHAQ